MGDDSVVPIMDHQSWQVQTVQGLERADFIDLTANQPPDPLSETTGSIVRQHGNVGKDPKVLIKVLHWSN